MRVLLLAAIALGQLGLDAPPRPKQFVVYAAEEQVIAPGKRGVLELRFEVQGGFHVNSHTPASELQIATRLELGSSAGVKVGAVEYPMGTSYRQSGDAAETLDVYSNRFSVKVPVVATPGPHELKGTLTYQACDKAACYPPKTLLVDVLFRAE